MDYATTSRRALLGTVAAIGAAVVVPAVSIAAAPDGERVSRSPAVSLELLALITEADRRDAASARYEREVFDKASAAFKAAEAAIPHIEFEAGYATASGARPILSTARRDQVAVATSMVKHPPEWSESQTYYRAQRKLLAASKWRDRAVARARRASGVDAAYDQTWALGDRLRDADMAVVDYPAATLADLLAVMAFAERRGLADDQDYINALSSGIRRLAGEAQA